MRDGSELHSIKEARDLREGIGRISELGMRTRVNMMDFIERNRLTFGKTGKYDFW
jgi:predicted Rossmann fold nucleotide-binding protein DprA/Smf involved in DNA uptake